MRYLCAGVSVLVALSAVVLVAQRPAASRYLVTWVSDIDSKDSDFLAVLDALPGSKTFGQVLSTIQTGERGTIPHHTEHDFAPGHPLFANGYNLNRTFRFDLTDPSHPKLMGSIDAVPGLAFPHSFARLPNGNLLATMQATGPDFMPPGGLAEFRDDGSVVRSASAANDVDPGTRLYSLLVLPTEDRIIVGGGRMGPRWATGYVSPLDHTGFTMQLWRLSDLKLLKTVALTLPPGARVNANNNPYEPRRLANGEVMLATGAGGFYWITGLDAETFKAEFVYDFGSSSAVPVVVGNYWIQPVTGLRRVVAVDVSNPKRPVEVSRLEFDEHQAPHWLSLDPRGNRLVLANSSGDPRLWMLRFEPSSGRLSLDDSFREPGSEKPGVSFDREEWPHGRTGPGMPHGSVFIQ